MTAPTTGVDELVRQMATAHGEDAVRRALQLVPLLALVRDNGDFYLSMAAGAAVTEGVVGTLVLELPRKSNQPTEVTFIGGRATLSLTT